MDVKCPRCGVVAEVTVISKTKYRTTEPMEIFARCPVVQERLAQTGKMVGSADCPHMDGACSDAFRRLWGR